MPDSYEIRPLEAGPVWDDFVHRANGGTVFSTDAWLHCAQRCLGGQIRRYGCFKNGRLTAGVSGLARTRLGLRSLSTPPLTPHGGLLLAPVASKGPAKTEAEWNRATDELVAYLQGHYHHTHLVLSPAIADIRPFTWKGWSHRARYTYQFQLGDEDSLWERLERRTRTVIRKAEKSDFRVRQTDDLDLFRRQYESIYSRQGGAPAAAATVQHFVGEVLAAGLGRALVVESAAGQAAAIVVFVHGFDTVYAWQAGADPAQNNSGALSLLYWRLLVQAPRAHFDFVGANLPSIAHFKRGFGGDLVPYHAIDGFSGGWPRRLYSLWRGHS
ncbi:MAG: GNAT family N-acetyltransferase [Candidatus Latescibacteria bacterium]|nr:GNAT family N-acetyltransferase [Candidatus Latescibacterota bacterium]